MKHRVLLTMSVAALAFCGPAVAAGTATAAAGTATGTAGAATVRHAAAGHRYCVAVAARPGQAAPSMSCYRTFAASIRAATRGRVRLPASAKPGSVTPDQINAADVTPATVYVLSIDFANAGYGGSSLTWTQSSKCGAFLASSMPSGWNDVISSVQASSGCATTLFWNINFGSPTYPIAKNGAASSLGVFNDEASSQSWCTAEPCGS